MKKIRTATILWKIFGNFYDIMNWYVLYALFICRIDISSQMMHIFKIKELSVYTTMNQLFLLRNNKANFIVFCLSGYYVLVPLFIFFS